MKLIALTLFTALSLGSGLRAADGGWIRIFNGKDLSGWKSNEAGEGKAGVFEVEDGKLKVSGGRSHLFYVGTDGQARFKNFEFKAKLMTTTGANSGIYFHTEFQDTDWPKKGFECQVNATHTDRKKTGGLYAVKDVLDIPPNKDDVWCDYYLKVEGKHVVIMIDGKVTTDWTEPDDWDPKKSLKNMDGRKLGEGTFAIQGHDPKSTTYYKDIFLNPLP